MLASAREGRADVYFDQRVDYPAVSSPFVIAVADLNNDTHPDLLVEPQGAGSILTYLGNGDGTFAAYTSSFSPGSGWSLAVGHLNGDAWLDVVQPSEGGGIYILLGTGSGSLGSPIFLDTPGPSPAYAVLGDFNEDGKLDIVASNYADQGTITIHLGAGDGSFGSGTTYPTPPGPRGIVTVDFNEDAHLDLAVAVAGTSFELNLMSVLLGNGDGTFSAKTDFTVDRTPYAIVAAYLNGDNDLDIATAGNDGKVAVLLGNGAGGFGNKTEFTAGELCTSLAAADIDGDGAIDLIASDVGIGLQQTRVGVLRGLGDGTFLAPVYHETLPSPITVAVEDLNHDARPDLAVASRDPDLLSQEYSVSVLLNCVPCAPTAVSVVLDRLWVSDGRVQASWIVPTGSSLLGTVQRRQDGGEWSDMAGPLRVEGPEFTYDDGAVTPGFRYAYRLSLRDQTDAWYTNEAWIFVPSVDATPARLSLRAPFPNPSRAGVTFRIGQPANGGVQLRVFDVRGREVAKVLSGSRNSGWSEASWDGATRSRVEAPSGVYFAVLEGNGEVVRRKFVLAR